MNTETNTHLPLQSIHFDPALQMRAGEIDGDFVATLADILTENPDADLDPVVAFFDSSYRVHFLGDGNHRFCAYRAAKRTRIPAKVLLEYSPGVKGYNAALRYALGANADQRSKPRTRNDIRKAVLKALSFTPRPGNREIADLCKTSHTTVNRIAKSIDKPAPETAPAPLQLDFFTRLQKSFNPLEERLKDFLASPIWTLPDIPAEQKLEGIRAARSAVKHHLEALDHLETSLRTGASAQ